METSREEELRSEFIKRYEEYYNKRFDDKDTEDAPVRSLSRIINDGELSPIRKITIDLRFSKASIMRSIESLIKSEKDYYEKLFDLYVKIQADSQGIEHPQDIDEIIKQQRRKRLPKRFYRRIRDLKLYEQQLEIWDAKEREKLSWSKIVDRFEYITNIGMARDYYDAAKEKIKVGPPFGYPSQMPHIYLE